MKNIHHIIEQEAVDSVHNHKIIDRIASFYWKYGVLEALQSLENEAVYVRELGTFVVSYRQLRSDIFDTVYALRVGRARKETSRIITKKRQAIARLQKLLPLRNQMATRIYNYWKLKKEKRNEFKQID